MLCATACLTCFIGWGPKMRDYIPGTQASPFSEGGRTHQKSLLSKIIDELQLDQDTRAELVQYAEDSERHQCLEEARLRGWNTSDPFIGELIDAQAFRARTAMSVWVYSVPTSRTPGRPPLDAKRCCIAMAAFLLARERAPHLSPSAAHRGAAEMLGPGIRSHHVEHAVRRIGCYLHRVENRRADDTVQESCLQLAPRAIRILIIRAKELLEEGTVRRETA